MGWGGVEWSGVEWCGVEGVSRLVEEKHKKQYNQKKSLQLLNNNRNRKKEEENETICIIIKIRNKNNKAPILVFGYRVSVRFLRCWKLLGLWRGETPPPPTTPPSLSSVFRCDRLDGPPNYCSSSPARWLWSGFISTSPTPSPSPSYLIL